MKKLSVGILAHVDSGKTTLTEAMMYVSGNIRKLGRVDHRDSMLDNFALERERGITIFSKTALLRYEETQFYLLDTPGHVDFSAEAERAVQVMDYAVLVISGSDGVQSHTSTLWQLLRKYRVPAFVFVNKMDLESADRDKVMAGLKSKLSDGCVDFGEKNAEKLCENIALCDEALLNKYYNDEKISDQDIISAVKNRQLFPVFFGSALKVEGVEPFLQALDRYTEMPVYGADFAARVFKISQDKSGARLTFLKVTGGKLRVRDILSSKKNKATEKVSQIRIYSGEKFTSSDEVSAGTVCAVTGVEFTRPGDSLGAQQGETLPVLEPVLSYSVVLPQEADPHTALKDFQLLEAEDPMLRVVWSERTRTIGVELMGEIQLEVLKAIIKERFGYQVDFSAGSIIYKETIEDIVEGIGHFEPLRHYAEVHLILKPLKRDSGLIFNTNCKEDLLDRNWQRLILTHLYEKTHLGVLTGSPITDMEITLVSGKAHLKHTEGGDFREATYRAVRQGLRTAKSVLLEPYYRFMLEVPTENIGRAMSDLTMMSGSFSSPEDKGELSLISGEAPVSEMRDYAAKVAQYTHGKGRISCTLKGYDVCHNADEVIRSIGYDPDSDTENTADSVFCSHGAGHTVKWNEVKEHMHLSSSLKEPQEKPSVSSARADFSRYRSTDDIFALDKELMEIFEKTYGPVKKSIADAYKKPQRTTLSFDKNKKKKPAILSPNQKEYLLVDGYNVIFSWENLKALARDNIDSARGTLVNILCNYRGFKKCELILVFDAYKVKGNHREVEREGNIDIVYTKEAETADTYIEKVSHELAKNHKVRVVTSDRMEQLIILGNGAIYVSSKEFYEEVRNAEEQIRSIIHS